MNKAPLLLGERYAPLTFTIGFLRAPLSDVRCEFKKWSDELGKEVAESKVSCSLSDSLHLLEPLTTIRTRQLLLSTKSEWTAYFENRIVGGDAVSVVAHLSQQLGCKGLAISCIPNTLSESEGRGRGTYGAVSFELFSETATDFLNYERSIAEINDAVKWRFVATGKVQPYERTDMYKKRSIRERFTCNLLEEYCLAIGVDVFSENYYGPEGILLMSNPAAIPSAEQISLTEARERLGLPN
jgi:hypothetical protein